MTEPATEARSGPPAWLGPLLAVAATVGLVTAYAWWRAPEATQVKVGDPAPDLFNEGQGTIVKGYYRDGTFEASELLARHDESYMPAEVIDALKEQGVYQEPSS